MIRRRITYVLVLAAALLFQITNENYLAHLLLAVVLALPVLSLLMSLPGILTCRLRLAADPGVLRRSEEGIWRIEMHNLGGLPLARLQLRMEERSLFTGKSDRFNIAMSGAVRRRPVDEPVYSDHCGLLELRCTKIRARDYLGLFDLPCVLPEPVRLLVAPDPLDPGPIELPEGTPGPSPAPDAAALRARGEDYDLREYRPGDPIRSVHWKLSSKWDELIVRDPLDSGTPLPMLTFDHFGDLDEVDEVLDRLTGLSKSMLAVQRPHAVLWLDPADGEPCRCAIRDEKDLRDCLVSILSQPCPPDGPSIEDRPELISAGAAEVFHLHVGPDGEGGVSFG